MNPQTPESEVLFHKAFHIMIFLRSSVVTSFSNVNFEQERKFFLLFCRFNVFFILYKKT